MQFPPPLERNPIVTPVVAVSRLQKINPQIICIYEIFHVQRGSTITSNSNLGIHGQGFFRLKGQGDMIIAQRLFVSLFYNVNVSY